jgi:putative ABC transport system substrate-binding protein
VNRREFIALAGGAAMVRPSAIYAQQSMPVVGLLRSTPAAPFADLVNSLRKGLGSAGFEEGRNVMIEQRWADNQVTRLPALAADLVQLGAVVIVGNQSAVEAARLVSAPTPLIFVTGEDPVRAGLVASMSRPGGNATGVTFFGGSQLNAKRIELLHELVPQAKVIAVLGDPNYPSFERELPDAEAAAGAFGWRVVIERAVDKDRFEPAFANFARSGASALLVSGSPFFTSQRDTLVELAARYKMPAVYDLRSLVAAGGLLSYSSSISDAYRQAGNYAGQILKGAKPAELPVLQATTFQLSINLRTAKALGLTVPPTLLARADEVIE